MSTASMDNGNSETVTLPEADEGGGETETSGAPAGGETAAQAQSRKERRKSEFDALQQNFQSTQTELARERQAREQLAREMSELRGRWEQSQQQQQRDVKDEYGPKIEQLESEAQIILRQIAASKDPAEQDRLMKAHNAKMREAARLDFKREMENEQRQQEPQQQREQMSPRDQAMAVAIEADYPFIWDQGQMGQVFRTATDRHYDRLRAEGKPDNLATLRAACAAAARDLKIGGNDSAPNRGAYDGHSAGDGGGGRGEGRPTVEFGKHQAALAQALANRRGTGATGEEAKNDWLKRVGPGVAKRLTEE